jgi:hypothetical protein
VLAPAEPLFFGGGDDLAVDDDRRCRVVKDGVDAEHDGHGANLPDCVVAVDRSVLPRGDAADKQTSSESD